MMIHRVAIGALLFSISALGMVVGGWAFNSPDPVQFQGRKVLTPIVKPGDSLKIELDNYRHFRCDQTTYRVFTKPGNERSTLVEDRPSAFGKLGRDVYTASIPTPEDAQFGKASLLSYTQRMCNPWEKLRAWMGVPLIYGSWADDFEFGTATLRVSPDEVKNSLTK